MRLARIVRKPRSFSTGSFSSTTASLEGFGDHVFKGAVAAPFLTAQGLSADALNGNKWTTDGSADKVLLASVV